MKKIEKMVLGVVIVGMVLTLGLVVTGANKDFKSKQAVLQNETSKQEELKHYVIDAVVTDVNAETNEVEYTDKNGDIWKSLNIKGVLINDIVTLYMSNNKTNDLKDDFIVDVITTNKYIINALVYDYTDTLITFIDNNGDLWEYTPITTDKVNINSVVRLTIDNNHTKATTIDDQILFIQYIQE